MGVKINPVTERLHLLRKLSFWRILALVSLGLVIIKLFFSASFSIFSYDYIGKIRISGFIGANNNHIDSTKILSDEQLKALIVEIDSPGGTFVGGEKIYNSLREISKYKPVIALLGNQATSAAYMAAIGADYIVSYRGSIVGSVGVILQSFEVSELAKKLGVDPIILKSNKYKGVPNLTEKLDEQQRQYLNSLLKEVDSEFLSMVKSRRSDLLPSQIKEIAAGKIFSAKTAKKLNLIDEIGNLENVRKWLRGRNTKTNNIIELNNIKQNVNKLFGGNNLRNFLNFKLLTSN